MKKTRKRESEVKDFGLAKMMKEVLEAVSGDWEEIRVGLRFCESGAEAIAGEARERQEAPVAHESHRMQAVNIRDLTLLFFLCERNSLVLLELF